MQITRKRRSALQIQQDELPNWLFRMCSTFLIRPFALQLEIHVSLQIAKDNHWFSVSLCVVQECGYLAMNQTSKEFREQLSRLQRKLNLSLVVQKVNYHYVDRQTIEFWILMQHCRQDAKADYSQIGRFLDLQWWLCVSEHYHLGLKINFHKLLMIMVEYSGRIMLLKSKDFWFKK